MRDTVHSLMKFLLRNLRSGGGMCFEHLSRLNAKDRFDQTMLLLSVPRMYLHSISLWPLSSMMTELAALPSEFITLFCCLVLEQSEALFAAVTATRANSILADPASRPPAYLRLQELNTSAWLMAIGRVLDRILQHSQQMHAAALSHLAAAPAVIQLYKRILLTYADIPGLAKQCFFSQTTPHLPSPICWCVV